MGLSMQHDKNSDVQLIITSSVGRSAIYTRDQLNSMQTLLFIPIAAGVYHSVGGWWAIHFKM